MKQEMGAVFPTRYSMQRIALRRMTWFDFIGENIFLAESLATR